MRIIPAIDIIDGKCVRLTKGDYNTKKIYNENPLEVAKEFEASGIEYLHVVDLDGAKASEIINYKTLEQIASKTNLKIDFGGGLKSDKDLEIAFNSGANQITGGSIAVKNPTIFESWISKYGSDKIILGADFYPDNSGGKIATNGWQEESSLALIPFVKEYQNKGIQYVICTDISKDGMLQGPSFNVYSELLSKVNPLKLIASGGISTFDELPKLAENGCEGVIIGKAIYENKISLKQLENFILNK
ncbi:1-(5-phosphoribosyl)-5-[(5-phosphoribosylamino)methylideneamino]imidazole-4-carboxamide isomerase [Polaribacter dokdonensis]|uniref:1-(5-phosphoribosyl)-5-[(5-phosphoribosylamino)methylideneamino] imidazole-4-carboxamide isomerase n=1 Tax=Polaribacter dokdonensis DSW-5 TaxID=1300348 RepID=A0A0M9CI50_9FLAO|nr:1-(5-phosphoribosyl)-5-[(5-phosphoribosylamino)methylideneamino]imidazole-4-carboxamide isomerase [Polaribacter dokdonensis]KOY52629.1 1-(5-phosphoribosyl)-5-[(5- phosphoribosylamino)methylideneamino] imidazole-4-carboxamide isomerase [Polaribacter dokdonensis DSW-5]SEE49318.1 1-(5-phosphoribosyl)-5-[(5-phosphoribosylamino)methylideneamino] imidazole-4-carboxamide isomerase [Polaribacter dokdonensis DSW-5]